MEGVPVRFPVQSGSAPRVPRNPLEKDTRSHRRLVLYDGGCYRAGNGFAAACVTPTLIRRNFSTIGPFNNKARLVDTAAAAAAAVLRYAILVQRHVVSCRFVSLPPLLIFYDGFTTYSDRNCRLSICNHSGGTLSKWNSGVAGRSG